MTHSDESAFPRQLGIASCAKDSSTPFASLVRMTSFLHAARGHAYYMPSTFSGTLASLFNKCVLFWIKTCRYQRKYTKEKTSCKVLISCKTETQPNKCFFQNFCIRWILKREENWHLLGAFCVTCPRLGALPPLDLHLFPCRKRLFCECLRLSLTLCPSEHTSLLTAGHDSNSNKYQR